MKLIIDLLMRTGSFQTDTDRAARLARRRAKEIEKSFTDAGRKIRSVFAGLAGGIGIAALMRTFAHETIKAQQEQAQLAAVVESTGKAAGFSVAQLNKMADELARVSTFDGGDINRAQARLLSYTGIVGDTFPRAMQATIDMATRMGMSVEQSAETIGRALDIPSQGLTALTRQGFRFTEEQKKAVEQLERTGRVAEAQAIVLGALESSYGGAAQAARDTFGGAIAALQSTLRSLMTGDDGSLEGARDAVESLVKVLDSPETRQAFNSMITSFATLIEWTVKATEKFIRFGEAIGDALGETLHGPADVIGAKIKYVGDQLAFVEKQIARAPSNSPLFDQLTRKAEGLRKELDRLREAQETRRMMAEPGFYTFKDRGGSTGGAGGPVPPGAPSDEEIRRLAQERAAAEAREQAAKNAARQADAYIASLKRQLQATEELTVVERTLEEIRAGSLAGGGKQRQQEALEIAAALDEHAAAAERARQAEEELQALIRNQEAIYEEGRRVMESMRTPSEQLNVEIARLNLLLEKGAIDWETYARAMFAAQEDFDRAQEAADRTTKKMDSFAKNAAENIQRNLGDSLVDAMNGNFKDIGDSFLQMINRLIAEAMAADIARALFGTGKDGGVSGTGGWLGSALGAVGDFFGFAGAKAGGGDVLPNRSYWVGERGPEEFVPRTAGTIIPARQAAGVGDSVSVQMTVVTRDAESFRRSEGQIKSRLANVALSAQRFA